MILRKKRVKDLNWENILWNTTGFYGNLNADESTQERPRIGELTVSHCTQTTRKIHGKITSFVEKFNKVVAKQIYRLWNYILGFFGIEVVFAFLTRFFCPGFRASRAVSGTVRRPSVDVMVLPFGLKFVNRSKTLSFCVSPSSSQRAWEILRCLARSANSRLPLPWSAPRISTTWLTWISCNLSISSGV